MKEVCKKKLAKLSTFLRYLQCKRVKVGAIRITFPCNIYPLISHFYIAKLGYACRVYLFFSFIFAENIGCGYSFLNEINKCLEANAM